MMDRKSKKTARMPATKFPKFQKKMRSARMAPAKPVAHTEKNKLRNRKRFP
jgi:hypothetical protein